MNYSKWAVLAAMAVFSVLGDWFLAKYAKQQYGAWSLVTGFLCCNCAIACFTGALLSFTLFETSVYYDVITTAAIMAMSIFIFKETVSPAAIFWGSAAVLCVFMMQRSMPD